MSGQSKPTCAARELSFCASSNAGMEEEIPAKIDGAVFAAVLAADPAVWLRRFFLSSTFSASQLRFTSVEVSAFVSPNT